MERDPHRVNARQVQDADNRQEKEIQVEERRHEVAEPKRVRREPLAEVATVKGVASELTKVRKEERTPVMIHDDPRIVDNALPAVDDVLAEKRVLSRPEVRAIPADPVKKVLADEQVAARVVLDILSHAAGAIAIAVVAADEEVVVDASADAREEAVSRRCHAGTADCADVGLTEVLDRIFEPMRVRIGIVVDERDDLAPRLADADVPLLRRPHLTGGDDTNCLSL